MITLELLTRFYMWSAIISVIIFLIWILSYLLLPDLIYKMQTKFFPISREKFDIIFYGYLGLYKLLITIFIFIPYIALLMIN